MNNTELYHYGVKGMKWGVRRTPEQLGRRKKQSIKVHASGVPIHVISGHSPSPKVYKPYAVIDHKSQNGKVDVRSFYNEFGMKQKDIHTTNHGNPKTHPYGKRGEHIVEYEWYDNGYCKNKIRRNLNDQERRDNGDIL